MRGCSLLLLLLWGCAQQPDRPLPGELPPGEVAFVVDGVAVPEAALDALITRIPREQSKQLVHDGRTTEFIEHVALTQALYQRALAAGLEQDPSVAQAMAMAQREFLAAEYLRWEARRRVTPERVAERHAQMPEFQIPQLHLRHLRLQDQAQAPAMREALAQGTPFPDLARRESTDQGSAESGGDLGWLDLSLVERTFGAEVAQSPPGSVQGPVQLAGGWHLVLIEERREQIPLSEVEAGLTSAIVREEMERISDEIQLQMKVERPAARQGS
jgi:peptidyl-prolyl cis-trans isomerase C